MAKMASIHADQTTIPSEFLSSFVIHAGNNLDVLPTLPDNSVDSIVTDPPYELNFMNRKWDNSGIAYSVELWTECLRVLKPGGHLLSFGGTRTWHRVAVAIEDAGFDVRDSIAWMYGSGFPKSLDVSKAIDKSAGAERELRVNEKWADKYPNGPGGNLTQNGQIGQLKRIVGNPLMTSAPSTPEAEQWQGWGTALKPAFEPIVVARKPLAGKTVAANVLEHGTGALNIDGSRIGTGTGEKKTVHYPDIRGDNYQQGKESYSERGTVEREVVDKGRWPANVILDEYSAGELDEQSGTSSSKATAMKAGLVEGIGSRNLSPKATAYESVRGHSDTGGASRFFYCAKASKRDRNEGLEGLPKKDIHSGNPNTHGTLEIYGERQGEPRQNFHPTVKPTNLMRYLVKLVTPPGGTVLDPFTGSGSTGKAAILEGFDFIGIEMTEEYLPIIDARLKHAEQVRDQQEQAKDEGLF
jgi:DNA modification methylase